MKRIIFLILFLLMVPLVVAQSLEVVPGTKQDGNVYHSFDKADISVVPETAYSTDGTFNQTTYFTNTYNTPVYVYFDAYFNESIKGIGYEEYKAPTYSYKERDYKTWGEAHHYHTTEGTLVQPGETVSFRMGYEIEDIEKYAGKTGKWNARLWGTLTDDWTKIESQEALFDYAIDPVFSQVNATGEADGIHSYEATEWAMQDFIANMTGTVDMICLDLGRGAATDGTVYVELMDENFTSKYMGSIQVSDMPAWPAHDYVCISENTFFVNNASRYNITAHGVGNTAEVYWAQSVGDQEAGIQSCRNQDNYTSSWETCVRDNGYQVWGNESGAGGPPAADPPGIEINYTYTAPILETINQTHFLNVTWYPTGNVSNVTSANLSYNGVLYLADINEVGSNWTSFNYSDLPTPIVYANSTNLQFNWTYNVLYNNSIEEQNQTSNVTQPVNWAFYPQNIGVVGNVTEATTESYTYQFEDQNSNVPVT